MASPFDDFDNKNDNLLELINKIDELNDDIMNKYHVNGRVYEYFLGFVTAKN